MLVKNTRARVRNVGDNSPKRTQGRDKSVSIEKKERKKRQSDEKREKGKYMKQHKLNRLVRNIIRRY